MKDYPPNNCMKFVITDSNNETGVIMEFLSRKHITRYMFKRAFDEMFTDLHFYYNTSNFLKCTVWSVNQSGFETKKAVLLVIKEPIDNDYLFRYTYLIGRDEYSFEIVRVFDKKEGRYK